MQVEIKEIVHGSEDYQLAVNLRMKILREPLGLTLLAEDLAKEADAIHVGAFVEAKLMGCLFLSPQNEVLIKMRQVAVSSESQGLGIGKKLVIFAEQLACAKGFNQVVLNARETAISFYASLGYEQYDELFIQVGLPHRKMRKSICLSQNDKQSGL